MYDDAMGAVYWAIGRGWATWGAAAIKGAATAWLIVWAL